MSKLTANAVNEIFHKCLFEPGEDTTNHIPVQGIMHNIGFHPQRVAENKEKIIELLAELPDEFNEKSGGGWSFLQACMDKHGNHWAEHPTMEQLFILGMAVKRVKYLLPREMWAVLPGGVPYFAITEQDIA